MSGARACAYLRQKIQDELMTQSASSFCSCTSRLSCVSVIIQNFAFQILLRGAADSWAQDGIIDLTQHAIPEVKICSALDVGHTQ